MMKMIVNAIDKEKYFSFGKTSLSISVFLQGRSVVFSCGQVIFEAAVTVERAHGELFEKDGEKTGEYVHKHIKKVLT